MDPDLVNLTIASVSSIATASSWVFAIWNREVMIKRGLDAQADAIRAAQSAASVLDTHEQVAAKLAQIKALRAPCATCGAEPPPLPPLNP